MLPRWDRLRSITSDVTDFPLLQWPLRVSDIPVFAAALVRNLVAAVLIVELLAGVLIINSGSSTHSVNSQATDPVVATSLAALPQPDAMVIGDHRRMRFISLGHSRTDKVLMRIGAHMNSAIEAVEGFWGTDWGQELIPHSDSGIGRVPEIIVIATDTEAQFIAHAGLDPQQQWSNIAAVSVADEVDFAHRRVVGQRIVLAPGASAMSDEALRIVLTHELFHHAARVDTAIDAPRWLAEGVADFVARPVVLPFVIDESVISVDFPNDSELDAAPLQHGRFYDRAWWFTRFVAERFGAENLRQLYLQACAPGHANFASAAQSSLGVDLSELHKQWVQWLDDHRG